MYVLNNRMNLGGNLVPLLKLVRSFFVFNFIFPAINLLSIDHVNYNSNMGFYLSSNRLSLNGLWVVFEDIDEAPADVQSILLTLL